MGGDPLEQDGWTVKDGTHTSLTRARVLVDILNTLFLVTRDPICLAPEARTISMPNGWRRGNHTAQQVIDLE
jgi:hypothetical protein